MLNNLTDLQYLFVGIGIMLYIFWVLNGYDDTL